MSVLTDLRNRGVEDVFFVVCDGLKGLPEVVTNAIESLNARYRRAIKARGHFPSEQVCPLTTGGSCR